MAGRPGRSGGARPGSGRKPTPFPSEHAQNVAKDLLRDETLTPDDLHSIALCLLRFVRRIRKP